MKKIKIKKDLFNRIKEIGSENKVRGITLISLVITIIVLLILAGITIVAIKNVNILTRSKQAKDITRYETAKETIDLKLIEVQTDCYSQNIDYNLLEIEKAIKDDEKITIEKFYNSDISKLKQGVTENIVNLSGIVVSVNEYEEYKFLIGKQGEIIGATTNKITDITDEREFENLENFEKNTFGKNIKNPSQSQTKTKEITEIPEGTDTTKSGAYTGSTQYGTFWFPAKENAKGFNTFSSSSRMINARVFEQSNVKALLLEKGIEYKISCNIRTYCNSGHGFEFGLYDVKNKKFVLSKKENYTSGNTWRNLRADYTYTPEEDLRVIYAYDMTNGSGYSYVGRGIVSFNTNEQNTKLIDEIKYNDATINGSVYPTIKSSNNVLEKTSTTSVKLLANKTYKITYKYALDLPNATWGKLRLWNFTTNSAIDTYEWTTQYSNTEYTIIYHTTTDTQIGLYINRDGGTSDGRVVDGTKIIVEELN